MAFRTPQLVGLLGPLLLFLVLGCSAEAPESSASSPEAPNSQEAPESAVAVRDAGKGSVQPARTSGTSGGAHPGEGFTIAIEPLPELPAPPLPEKIPAGMQSCVACHRSIVAEYLAHGMAGSVGPLGEPPTGEVVNETSGRIYRLVEDGGEGWMETTFADGGTRRQRLVGRIGAGIFDTSWVTEEVDPWSGEATGRLFFAPVETVTGYGHALSPFDLAESSPGLEMELTEGCLTCHTTADLSALPGAAKAAEGENTKHVFPPNALGSWAFDQLPAIGCEACHGDADEHLAIVEGLEESLDTGLPRLASLPAGTQRDVCSRCHLQGESRFDLVDARPSLDRPLAAQIPALVSDRVDDDFRFVGQMERLALSPCFQGTPEMTCSTCHEPHTSAARQGTARFDATCASCHDFCSRPASLRVEEVTGDPPRTEAGCVDCHLRRSQPYDLPHVRSADHYIRRRIPKPVDDIPHRQFADREGPVRLYDDGRLQPVLSTAAGKRWQAGIEAIGLLTMGRVEDAAARFETFPPPGTEAARAVSAPDPLMPLQNQAAFHQARALTLMATGKVQEALRAFDDAVLLDPLQAGPRLGRARLRFDLGDVEGALVDTQAVIDTYPRAEQPWDFRVYMAERLGRTDLALGAMQRSTRIWPPNASHWFKQGLLLRQQGNEQAAREAIRRARALEPSLELPGAGPVTAH